MKTYAIEVTELHVCKRTYYINAESKREAKREAKYGEFIDASEAMWEGYSISKVGPAIEHKNDLTTETYES